MKKIVYLVLLTMMLALITGCGPGTGVQISTPVPDASAPDGQIDVPGFNIQLNAPGVNPLINKIDSHNRVSGILAGIWHGIISPVTLIISFINPNVQMYEVHNDGGQYNLGFLLGVAIVFLILGILLGRRRR